jgi:hypothetical protein
MSVDAKLINYNKNNVIKSNYGNKIVIEVPTNFGFYKGDYIAFYNPSNAKILWGEIVAVVKNTLTIDFGEIKIELSNFTGSDRFEAYWSNKSVPFYATFSPSTQEFVWDKPIPQSELQERDPLYNTTYSNGCFYMENNISLYLQRQDPVGKYGLSTPLFYDVEEYCPMEKYVIMGENKEFMEDVVYDNNNLNPCV